ncbi:MAG: virulence RhuM family protein [Fibrobacter sp.]|nr:virulence RhuM family protein [Fibrobacter sp.]
MNNANEIQPLVSDFERIKQVAADGRVFWSARNLGSAMGYSTYQKFERVLVKTIAAARAKGMVETGHFNQTVEMVRLGSGSFRKVENYHLSREACLAVAENADSKKPQVQMALRYFSQSDSFVEIAQNNEISSILLYKTSQGESRIEVIFNSETFWMPQKRMAELYGVEVNTVNYHLKEIFASGELVEPSVIRKIGITAADGKVYDTKVYNLDAIIAVGYRVNSYQATQFRIWATTVLKEMIVKGFVLDDERLKQGTHFGKDYFDDLLERIREIRASERRYYQKITDVYAECSADYDPKSEATLLFFKIVQNMMHWAVTHQTAAEIIYSRANAERPHMGLTTWKKAPEGRVQRSDTIVAKNYLSDKEISTLNRLSTAFLDFAETQAERHIVMNMADWQQQLEKFLSVYNFDILQNAGTVSAEDAKQKAFDEYDKFKLVQDRDFLSDFDKEIKRLSEQKILMKSEPATPEK